MTLTTRVAAASSAKIFTPRLCNSSWNAADTLANSALRSEERFRNSNLTEDPWMEAQAFLASRRADSSKVSALAGRGKKTKAKKSTNGSSWQRIARPRERGEHKFCLADTGLLDDDITAANRGSKCRRPGALYPFEDRSPDPAKICGKCFQPRETIYGRARPSKKSDTLGNLCPQG